MTIYLPPDSPLVPFGEACGHDTCEEVNEGDCPLARPEDYPGHCEYFHPDRADEYCTGTILTTKRQEALAEVVKAMGLIAEGTFPPTGGGFWAEDEGWSHSEKMQEHARLTLTALSNRPKDDDKEDQ